MDTSAAFIALRAEYEAADRMYSAGELGSAFKISMSVLQTLDRSDTTKATSAQIDTLRADLFNLLGSISNDTGRFEQGRTCFHEAITLYARGLGSDDLQVYIALSNLAISLHGTGRSEESIRELNAACGGFRRKLEPQSRAASELSRTLGTLGGVQAATGLLNDARKSLQDALQVSDSIGDRRTVSDVVIEASHYNTLGIVERLDCKAMKSMSVLETGIANLVLLRGEHSQQVYRVLTALVDNYDLSKAAAGIAEDATIVVKARWLVRRSNPQS